MQSILKHILISAVMIGLTFNLSSCNNDDDVINTGDPQNTEINNWVYDMMKTFYYWTDDIPATVDKSEDPSAFFQKLLHQDDRFSIIVPDFQELVNSLSGVQKEPGYEFALARVQDSNDVIAVVLYVKEGSPADNAGLKRGDVISKINNTTITLSNYQELVPSLYGDHSFEYRRYNDQLAVYEDKGSITVTAVVYSENPNFMDTVLTVGNKKIGYYVYNFFSPGTDGSSIYDIEMDQVIAKFSSEGINAMVLDLRYNSGGAVTSATNLASLIGTGVSSGKIFYQSQYNDLYQAYINDQPDGDKKLKQYFTDKAINKVIRLEENYIFLPVPELLLQVN